MTTASWNDVIARVRGLASRLLGRAELERLASSRSLPAFVGALETTTYRAVAELSQPVAAAIDRDTRRMAGERLAIVATWCGNRIDALAPLFEDEDRRNLRAITRGVAAHAAADQCTAGLLPTPALPNPALEELARQPALAGVAATLVAWGNPYGRAIVDEAARETPSLFAIQFAVDREYAERATRAAARTGEPLVKYVQTLIDVENARTALAAAAGVVEHESRALFIAGGRLISADVFNELAAPSLAEARERMLRVAAATVLAPMASRSGDDCEGAVLAMMLRDLRHAVRLNPLSLNVVLEYVLALRAELQDLARIIWGITLRVPARRIAAKLVTP